MNKESVGNRIKELCDKRGITLNRLAVQSQVPPSTLKNIIYGNVESTGVDTISKICDGLGISLQEFFTSDLFGQEEKTNGYKD